MCLCLHAQCAPLQNLFCGCSCWCQLLIRSARQCCRHTTSAAFLICTCCLQVHFVAMQNVLCSELTIHRRYNLKGSSMDRSVGDEAAEVGACVDAALQ